MNKTIKRSLQSLLLVPVLALGFSAALTGAQVSAQAQNCDTSDLGINSGVNCAQGEGQSGDVLSNGSIFRTVTDTLLFIIGAVAVIMLIYGGFKYVTSGGDSSAVTSAKNTILYAVVGIIVAILAYAILTFVVGSLGGSGASNAGSNIGGQLGN